MPSLQLDDNRALYQIRAFQIGMIQVNDKKYSESLIVTPTQLIESWAPQIFSQLTANDLQMVAKLKPDIILLGTGSTLIFPSIEMYGDLINQGIGVEIMDTRAACRTYNALSAENRNVAACLIIR